MVITAPSDRDARFRAQKDLLENCRAGLTDRDIVVLEDVAPAGTGHVDATFRIYLVGKDGGVKLASEEPVSPQALFALIDGMPMRQSEIRARGGRVDCAPETGA